MSTIVAQIRPTISNSVVKDKTVKPEKLCRSVSQKTVPEFKNINKRVNLPPMWLIILLKLNV